MNSSTVKKENTTNKYYATGRRKCSVARVWVFKGTGKITVNGKTAEEHFGRDASESLVLEPFIATQTSSEYDVIAFTKGGGLSGQAGALRHGISRALDKIDANSYHKALRSTGLLTRDSRMVERKKYGRRKARRGFQFSKR